jgi:large subunit ribosomal protein L13
MSTVFAHPEKVRRDWFVVDASGKTLGRLATQLAFRLRGKHKPEYTPHVDTGDHIIVLNADKIHVTGDKLTDKTYYWHTGAIGGIKSRTLDKMLETHPERVIEIAVKGMLPHNKLGNAMYRKLNVYPGADHPHQAQRPRGADDNEQEAS